MDRHSLFEINGFYPLTLPIRDVVGELIAFEKMISEEENGNPLVEYHGHRHARPFDIGRLPDSLYHAIITDDVIDMMTHHYNGREPFMYDSVFMYAKANAPQQPLHRDVALMQFAPVSLIFDIASTAITTMFIAKSHRSAVDSNRAASSLSTHHNAVLFNCFIQHQGAATTAPSCKMSLTFIPQWQGEVEKACFAEHSYAFGIADKDGKLKGQLLPLISLRR